MSCKSAAITISSRLPMVQNCQTDIRKILGNGGTLSTKRHFTSLNCEVGTLETVFELADGFANVVSCASVFE
jgi:hypothetical protein